MAKPHRVTVVQLLKKRRPGFEDDESLIGAGRVLVDNKPVLNPKAMVSNQASLKIMPAQDLQGAKKLRAALDFFNISPQGLIAVDCGASTGGFTSVLLERGCKKAYAVDVGHGQLLGSLRHDDRVINLERTNIADLTFGLVPDDIDLVTVDLSYLALSEAIPQIMGNISLAPLATFVVVVKPMYELRLATAPSDNETLHLAVNRAQDSMSACGFTITGHTRSPVLGSRGAIEFLMCGKTTSKDL